MKNYLSGEIGKEVTVIFSAKKLLRYFIKSFGWLVVHVMQSLEQWMSKQKFICDPSGQLTLIDIHLAPEQILKDGDLVDSDTFTLTVNPVNDAPILDEILDQK